MKKFKRNCRRNKKKWLQEKRRETEAAVRCNNFIQNYERINRSQNHYKTRLKAKIEGYWLKMVCKMRRTLLGNNKPTRPF